MKVSELKPYQQKRLIDFLIPYYKENPETPVEFLKQSISEQRELEEFYSLLHLPSPKWEHFVSLFLPGILSKPSLEEFMATLPRNKPIHIFFDFKEFEVSKLPGISFLIDQVPGKGDLVVAAKQITQSVNTCKEYL